MPVKERDVLLQGKDKGQQTIDYPITKLENVDGTAPVKTSRASSDYVPIMGSDGEMQKIQVDKLLNTGSVKSITIPISGWADGTSGDYSKYIDVTVSGMTANHNPVVILDVASQKVAVTCGLCSTVESLAGKLRFRSKSVPTTAMTGVFYILGTVI